MVIVDQHPVKMDRHFSHLHPLTLTFNKDIQLKTCIDVPNQKVIDKVVDQLNSKTISKTIISDQNLPSNKLKISYVGPLYIFSKHDKFLYLLPSIDGEVIEQMFHVSHLNKVFYDCQMASMLKTSMTTKLKWSS